MATFADTNTVKFWRGIKENLPAAGSRDTGTIYFVIPDAKNTVGEIYLGSNLVAQVSSEAITAIQAQLEKINEKFAGFPEGKTIVSYITEKIKDVTDTIGDMSGLTGNLAATTLVAAILELNGKINICNENDETMTGLIEDLQTSKLDIDRYESEIGDPTKYGKTLVAKIDEIISIVGVNSGAISTLQSDVSTLKNDKLDKSVYNTQIGAVTPLGGKTVVTSIVETGNAVNNLSGRVGTLETKVEAINSAFVFKGNITQAGLATENAGKGFAFVASEPVTLTDGSKMEVGDLLIVTAAVTGKLSTLTKGQYVIVERNIDGAIVKSDEAAVDTDGFAVFKGNNEIAKSSESISTLKTYTDTAKAAAISAFNDKIGEIGDKTVKEYADDIKTAVEGKIDASLGNLGGNATVGEYIESAKNQAISSAKTYTDNKVGNIGVDTVKEYVDTRDAATQTAAVNAAKGYTDSEIATVMTYLTWTTEY